MRLLPCTSCRRHVRDDSARCPFCHAVAALAFALVVVPASAHADSEERPAPEYGSPPSPVEHRANAVQAELGLGVVGLAYERVLSRRLAVQISAQTFGTWWGPYFDMPRFSGFGGQLRPTIFVTGDAPRGVYVAPFFRGAAVSSTKDGVTGRGFGWSAGAWGGYSFMLYERVNVRVGGGLQYMHYAVDAGPHRIEWKRFYPALDLVVGYTF